MPEVAADAALFEGAVACDLVARMALRPGPLPAGAGDAAERLLRDLAQVEERRAEPDDAAHPPDPGLRRLEAKLDLAMQLLARALPGLAVPAAVPVRLSARGVRVAADASIDATEAFLEWQPGDGLPLLAALPVRRLAVDATHAWWAFDDLEPGLQDLLERHVFRLHRRALAAQRRG